MLWRFVVDSLRVYVVKWYFNTIFPLYKLKVEGAQLCTKLIQFRICYPWMYFYDSSTFFLIYVSFSTWKKKKIFSNLQKKSSFRHRGYIEAYHIHKAIKSIQNSLKKARKALVKSLWNTRMNILRRIPYKNSRMYRRLEFSFFILISFG